VLDVFGKQREYTILSTLGRGAESVVYRAQCNSERQEVSLKIAPVTEYVQLHNEANMLTVLAGIPGVPTLLSCGMTQDMLYYYSSTDVVGIQCVISEQIASILIL
jgi:predicted Ser/Thr protein kinase